MSAKLTERVYLGVSYEMAQWLDEIGRQNSFVADRATRGATIRALLQTIMDEQEKAA